MKLDKQDVKSPDQMTQALRQGFVWTTGHSKIVFGLVGVFVVVGLIYSFVSYRAEAKEVAQQERYFSLEKAYTEKKRGFEEADRAALIAAQNKDKKNTPAVDASKKASGDLDKDYGTVVAGFAAFIQEAPQTKAAQMAALNLSEIYLNYKKTDEAFATLEGVEKGLDKKDMLTALVLMQMGNVKATQGECQAAISKWENITANKALIFAHDEAKLRMGICYESLQDYAKAEQSYLEVGKNNPDSTDFTASREAERYLRILKAKQNL